MVKKRKTVQSSACRFNKCDRPRVAKGCCRAHYQKHKQRICSVRHCHKFVPKTNRLFKYCSNHQSGKNKRQIMPSGERKKKSDAKKNTRNNKNKKKLEFECPICFQCDGHETALDPCGHIVCSICTCKISRCPFCRKLIHRELRLFK